MTVRPRWKSEKELLHKNAEAFLVIILLFF